MKQDKVSTFFKSKGFYVSLFSGVAAVFLLALTYANRDSDMGQGPEGTPNLTENSELPGREENPNLVEMPSREDNPNLVEIPAKENKPEVAELDPVGQGAIESKPAEEQDPGQVVVGAELESEYGQVTLQIPDSQLTQPVTTANEIQNALQNLTFQEEAGLLWPAEGSIIKHYSVEKLVYFDTLNQYKWNPAVMIGLEAGSDVLCGAAGVVTAIGRTEELGNSIVVDIGNGYQLKYAQIQEPHVKVGDLVEEGQVLAQLADPTIYYTEEGSNLYFQVLKDGESVNPLLLLR